MSNLLGGDVNEAIAGWASDLRQSRTCRFCGETEARLVHYGTRAYAHTACLVEAKGEDFVLGLPIGYLSNVSPMLLSEAGRKRLFAKLKESHALDREFAAALKTSTNGGRS